LIIVWKKLFGQAANIWDAEKGKLRTIGIPDIFSQGLRMLGDGSRVLNLHGGSIQAWDIWTGESVWEGRLDGIFDTSQSGNIGQLVRFDTFRMDGSKVLVRFGEIISPRLGLWNPRPTPIQFSETSSGRAHLNFIDVRKWSKDSPVRIEDGVTGKEVFQLYGKYANLLPHSGMAGI
jgi:hypothetical protein